jgi:hypothetical protein
MWNHHQPRECKPVSESPLLQFKTYEITRNPLKRFVLSEALPEHIFHAKSVKEKQKWSYVKQLKSS